MIRRDFIKSSAVVGLGLILGLPRLVPAADVSSPISTNANTHPTMRYPHGGCTESGIVAFDKGPYGRDPFKFQL